MRGQAWRWCVQLLISRRDIPSKCPFLRVMGQLAILADHVKSIDWKARRAEKVGRCPVDAVDEVRARLAPLLGY